MEEEDALKLMEEMDRFEAEIASDAPPPEYFGTPRAIIGANTFHSVQQKLDNHVVNARLNKFDEFRALPSGPAGPLVALQLQPPPPPPVVGGYPGPMTSAIFPSIPPPPPPPSFLIPHQVRAGKPPVMGLPPPPPPLAAVMMPKPRPGPVVLSAAPTKYKAPSKKSKLDDEVNEFLNEIKKEEDQKSVGKMMAEKVKANTVVSIQSVSSDSHEFYNVQPGHSGKPKKQKKDRKLIRSAGGQVWEDNSLVDWEDDDFRIFCGDLGNDVTDEVLIRAFNKYPSFLRAKVVRDKRSNKTKGFGFISFKDPQDFIKAMKEMNGRYVGSRPIKLRKSCWRQRSLDVVKKKEKEKAALVNLLTGRQ